MGLTDVPLLTRVQTIAHVHEHTFAAGQNPPLPLTSPDPPG